MVYIIRKKYLANKTSKEIHKVANTKYGCHLSQIKNRKWLWEYQVEKYLNDGYNGCCHCFKEKDTDKFDRKNKAMFIKLALSCFLCLFSFIACSQTPSVYYYDMTCDHYVVSDGSKKVGSSMTWYMNEDLQIYINNQGVAIIDYKTGDTAAYKLIEYKKQGQEQLFICEYGPGFLYFYLNIKEKTFTLIGGENNDYIINWALDKIKIGM